MSNLELLDVLKTRFEANMNLHKGIEWEKVQEIKEIGTETILRLENCYLILFK